MRRPTLAAVLVVAALVVAGCHPTARRQPPCPAGSQAVYYGRPDGTARRGGCVPVPEPHRPAVAVWGDSLTVEAAGALRADGFAVHAFGGTAPCDWAPTFARDLADDGADLVVIEFAGNTGSSCMAGDRTPGRARVRYRDDLRALAAAADALGVRVLLLAPPAFSPHRAARYGPLGAWVGQVEAGLAEQVPGEVSYSTAVADALTPGGIFRSAVGGRVLREVDGVHLTSAGVDLFAQAVLRAVGV